MNGGISSFFYFITGAALLLSVLGLWFTALIPGINHWGKRFFIGYFFVLLLSSVCVLIEMILHDYPVPSVSIYCLQLLESLLLSLPMPMQTAYLLHCCGESLRASKLLRAVIGLWAVFFVLLVSVPFIDGFIYIRSETRYYRGPLHPLLLTPIIGVLLLNFAGALRRRARLSRKAFLSFMVALAPMTITLIVNLFADAVPIFDISYVLSALAMYSLVLSDQLEQDRRQQREIANQRASIMVLQMRPHFIYNKWQENRCRL